MPSISYSGSEKTLIANGNIVPGLKHVKYTEKIFFTYQSLTVVILALIFSPTISNSYISTSVVAVYRTQPRRRRDR